MHKRFDGEISLSIMIVALKTEKDVITAVMQIV